VGVWLIILKKMEVMFLREQFLSNYLYWCIMHVLISWIMSYLGDQYFFGPAQTDHYFEISCFSLWFCSIFIFFLFVVIRLTIMH
jgi:uncharacterized membrane protein YhdT